LDLTSKIRVVPDFPKEGISFYDITTLLKDRDALKHVIGQFTEKFRDKGIEKIVSTESRGFIFGAALANELGAGFVPIRKAGKLPAETVKSSNKIEYGTREFEMHRDAINEGEKVLILDDLYATGGTTESAIDMVDSLGGDIIGVAFMIFMSTINEGGLSSPDVQKKTKGHEVFYLIDDKDIETN
jgi:adenine phosphoribosyltransferase